MKILFVGRSVFHFSYYESMMTALVQSGHDVVALFDEQWSKGQKDVALKLFAGANSKKFTWQWGRRRQGQLRDPLFGLRELRTYASYLSRPEQSDFYLARWSGYLPVKLHSYMKISGVRYLVRSKVAQKIFSWAEALTPASSHISEDIQRISPDVIVASPCNMRFDEGIEYIKAGKALKIPTAILVLSWDNLTTKGLFHVHPDLLLCWNQAHADEARAIHGIPEKNILKIGSTFFDKWFDTDRLAVERGDFCEQIGMDSNRPYFLYLGSSSNIAPDETWLVEELVAAMRNHPDKRLAESQMLVRPHPANAKNYAKIDGHNGIHVWPKHGTLPESNESQRDFFNSVRHSEASIGINTSGMIDSIILKSPCIALMVRQYAKTQEKSFHFTHLYNSGALDIANDTEECVKILRALLTKEDKKKLQREQFVRYFIRPNGLQYSAGDLAANVIKIIAAKKKGTQQAANFFINELGNFYDR